MNILRSALYITRTQLNTYRLLKTMGVGFTVISSSLLWAQQTPTLSPSAEAKFVHIEDSRIATLVGTSRTLSDGFHFIHKEMVRKGGVGYFYGEKSDYAQKGDRYRTAFLADNAKPGYRPQTSTSCVGFAMRVLRRGYEVAGMTARWNQIENYLVNHAALGTDLLRFLQQDGWEAVYFNADTSYRPNEIKWAKGKIDARGEFQMMLAKGRLYQLDINHRLLNFNPMTSSTGTRVSPDGLTALKRLEKVPFWVAVANGGYHVTTGFGLTVSESKLSKQPTNENLIQQSSFKEWVRDDSAHAPYMSGVIMVPPKTWIY